MSGFGDIRLVCLEIEVRFGGENKLDYGQVGDGKDNWRYKLGGITGLEDEQDFIPEEEKNEEEEKKVVQEEEEKKVVQEEEGEEEVHASRREQLREEPETVGHESLNLEESLDLEERRVMEDEETHRRMNKILGGLEDEQDFSDDDEVSDAESCFRDEEFRDVESILKPELTTESRFPFSNLM